MYIWRNNLFQAYRCAYKQALYVNDIRVKLKVNTATCQKYDTRQGILNIFERDN